MTLQLKGKLAGSGGRSILQNDALKSERQPNTSAVHNLNRSQAEMCNVTLPPCTSPAAATCSLTAQSCQEKERTSNPVPEPNFANIENQTPDGTMAGRHVLTCSTGDDGPHLDETASSSSSQAPQLGVEVLIQNPSAVHSVTTQESDKEVSNLVECSLSHEIIWPQVFARGCSEALINFGVGSSFSKISMSSSQNLVSQVTAMASDFYLPDDEFRLLKLQKLQLQSEGNFSGVKRSHCISSKTVSVGESGDEVCTTSVMEVSGAPKQQCKSPTRRIPTSLSENVSPLVEQDPLQSSPNDHCSPVKEYLVTLERGPEFIDGVSSTNTSPLRRFRDECRHCKCHVTRFESAGEGGGRMTEVVTTAPCSYHFQMVSH